MRKMSWMVRVTDEKKNRQYKTSREKKKKIRKKRKVGDVKWSKKKENFEIDQAERDKWGHSPFHSEIKNKEITENKITDSI